MTKFITTKALLILTLTACQSQNPKQQPEQEVVDRLHEWKENPSFPTHQLNPELIKEFQDSGKFLNDTKEGRWVEYSLDTSRMGATDTISFEGQDFGLTQSAKIIKEIGRYSKGQRQGIWTSYELQNENPPFSWLRLKTTNYKDGHKDGQEIEYQGFGDNQKPLIISNWKQGKEKGIHKNYDPNHPNNLLRVYDVRENENRLLRKYYPSGQLKMEFQDTTLNGKDLVYLEQFWESGQLRQTGFYTPDGKTTGVWTTHNQNGKIESQEDLTKK